METLFPSKVLGVRRGRSVGAAVRHGGPRQAPGLLPEARLCRARTFSGMAGAGRPRQTASPSRRGLPLPQLADHFRPAVALRGTCEGPTGPGPPSD